MVLPRNSQAILKCKSAMSSPEYGEADLYEVPLNEFEVWKANPPMRTEDHALRDLEERFDDKTGQLTPGHAVFNEDTGKFRILDMHRRFELAKQKEFKSLVVLVWRDVVVRSPRFDTLFDKVNGGQRLVNMRERIGLVLDHHPLAGGKQAIKITKAITDVLDNDALQLFRQENQPKSAVAVGIALIKDFVDQGLIEEGEESRRGWVSRYFIWQKAHGVQQAIKDWRTTYNRLKDGGSKREFKAMVQEAFDCILKDQALPSVMAFAAARASGGKRRKGAAGVEDGSVTTSADSLEIPR